MVWPRYKVPELTAVTFKVVGAYLYDKPVGVPTVVVIAVPPEVADNVKVVEPLVAIM